MGLGRCYLGSALLHGGAVVVGIYTSSALTTPNFAGVQRTIVMDASWTATPHEHTVTVNETEVPNRTREKTGDEERLPQPMEIERRSPQDLSQPQRPAEYVGPNELALRRSNCPNRAATESELLPRIDPRDHRPPVVRSSELSAATWASMPQPLGTDQEEPPNVAGNRPPDYPQLARSRGWEGVVMLLVQIEADGSISHVEVAESSGHSALDEEAVRAVRTWQATPARRRGVAVAAECRLPIRFRLR